MTRSKFSMKAALLAGGIGLFLGGFVELPTAAAQSYSDEYRCPAGFVYDPTYGSTLPGDAYHDFGYYGSLPYGTYEPYYGGHREFGHGFGHGMGGGRSIVDQGMGIHHSIVGVGHFGGGGFAHVGGFGHGGIGMGIAGGHSIGGGFGHGMAGGFGHGGGGGHR
jgi:hypothetical protein